MAIQRLQKTVYENYDDTPKDYQTPPEEVGAWDMEQITGKINELVDKETGEEELSSGLKRQVLEKQSSDEFDFKWNYRYQDFLVNVIDRCKVLHTGATHRYTTLHPALSVRPSVRWWVAYNFFHFFVIL